MKNIIYLSLCLVAFSACERDFFQRPITIDETHIGQLALTAALCDCDTLHHIFLTKTIGASASPAYTPIENAVLIVATQGNDYAFSYNPNTQFYEHPTTIPFKVGEAVSLTVDTPDFNRQTITQILPPNPTDVQIDTVGLLLRGVIGKERGDVREGNMSITLTDAPSIRNYYIIETIGEGKGVDLSNFGSSGREESELKFPLYLSSKDIYVEHDGIRKLFVNDQLFDGQRIEINFSYRVSGGWDEMDHITVRLRSVTREGYLYELTTDKYNITSFNPFAEQVISFSNTTEGVGIFSISSAISKRF